MTTTTLNPLIDTNIVSDSPTNNYGTNAALYVGESNGASGRVRRSLLKFDLSGIPANAIIDSAVLSLYAITDFSSNARTARVFRLKQAWTEAGCTWNAYDGTNGWQTAGGFGANDCEQTDIGSLAMTAAETMNAYKSWTLDAAKVQEMISGAFPNNGFLMKTDTEVDDMYAYNSNEAASNKPKLVIDWHQGGRQFQAVIIG